jgi:hypothetical protein
MSGTRYTIICPNPFHKERSVEVEGNEHTVSFERAGDVVSDGDGYRLL